MYIEIWKNIKIKRKRIFQTFKIKTQEWKDSTQIYQSFFIIFLTSKDKEREMIIFGEKTFGM